MGSVLLLLLLLHHWEDVIHLPPSLPRPTLFHTGRPVHNEVLVPRLTWICGPASALNLGPKKLVLVLVSSGVY